MLKYRIFQVIMAISVMMLTAAVAVVIAFSFRHTSEERYRRDVNFGKEVIEDGHELTELDAWLEYTILAEGFSDMDYSFDEGIVYINDYNKYRLFQLREIYAMAKMVIPISVIMLIIGFLVVKRRRMYECVVWGGAATTILGAVSFILVFLSKRGFFYGIKAMVFKSDYGVFFSEKDNLTKIIPEGLGLLMFLVYGVTILMGLFITIFIRYVTYKQSKPHQFK